MANVNVLVIFGPTAVGKTTISQIVAQRLQGEIITADSRQIYRKLDIGTAKPKQSKIRHWLVDIISPVERYDAALFVKDAIDAVRDISSRKLLPIVVGGTGLYIRALTEGLFPGEFRSKEIRDELRQRHKNGEDLYELLSQVDPEAAKKINPRNYVRIERALEVYLVSGKPISYWWKSATEPPKEMSFVKVGLLLKREILNKRIKERLEAMLANGWVDEVRTLLESGISRDAPAFSSIGYSTIVKFILGEITHEEMMTQIIRDTKRYAKRQITWFRKEPNSILVDITELSYDDAANRIVQIWNETI